MQTTTEPKPAKSATVRPWAEFSTVSGVSAVVVDRLDKASRETFPLRNIRAGHKYTAFIHEDSLYAPHLDWLVYETSVTDYVVFGFHDNDSVSVRKDCKEYTLRRTKKSAVINSSLWGAIMEQDLPFALAAEMEEIYQWTVDFFGIQKGDKLHGDLRRAVHRRQRLGRHRAHLGREVRPERQGVLRHPVPPGRQDPVLGGRRRQPPQADAQGSAEVFAHRPRFTYARKHPIYKVYRPHTGVDYAAPKGTPAHAVADGVVIFKGWGGGGGNTLKIKHPGNLQTGYLHLSGYAKGISKGDARLAGAVDRLRRIDRRLDGAPTSTTASGKTARPSTR